MKLSVVLPSLPVLHVDLSALSAGECPNHTPRARLGQNVRARSVLLCFVFLVESVCISFQQINTDSWATSHCWCSILAQKQSHRASSITLSRRRRPALLISNKTTVAAISDVQFGEKMPQTVRLGGERSRLFWDVLRWPACKHWFSSFRSEARRSGTFSLEGVYGVLMDAAMDDWTHGLFGTSRLLATVFVSRNHKSNLFRSLNVHELISLEAETTCKHNADMLRLLSDCKHSI